MLESIAVTFQSNTSATLLCPSVAYNSSSSHPKNVTGSKKKVIQSGDSTSQVTDLPKEKKAKAPKTSRSIKNAAPLSEKPTKSAGKVNKSRG